MGDLELKGLPDPVAAVAIGWERATAEAGVPIPHPLAEREGAFPFRGRAHDLESLTAIWKRTLHGGTTSCVLIAGEPGMGKTRLASEFAQGAHAEGALVLFGRCDEELGISYQPFVEALTHHAAHLDAEHLGDLGTHAAELARLVPELTDRFAGIGERVPTGDAEADQYRLFQAADSWLAAAAGAAGLVLVLDDIHWAARPTLLMLRHVLRSSTQARLMIVATYRDTDLDRTHPLADLLADLRRVPEVERLALAGLDRTGVEDLMEAVNQVELDESARELAAAVHSETEGNPFFVGELFRHLAESGALVNDGQVWRLAVSVAEMSIPDGIREVVGRRLSHLSEVTNTVLSWAAVIGRDLRLDVLAAVVGDQDDCLDAIDEAVAARLVDEVGVGRWRFSHALVRATLLAELRTTRKVRMHLAVGEAYEQLAPDEIAALAQHFSEAAPLGAGEKAVRYLVAAGDSATQNLAFDEAADLYRRALDIIDDIGLDVPELATDAWIGLAVAKRWTGGEFRDDVAQALTLATSIGDGVRMARVLLETSRGFVAQVFEVDEVRVAQLERCLDHLDEGDSVERVRMLAALSQELAYAGELNRQLALTDDALAMARRLDDPIASHEALMARSNVVQNVDHLEEMLAVYEEAESNLELIPTAFARAQVAGTLPGLGGWIGDRERFQAGLDGIEALGDALPPHYRWLLLAQKAGFELRWGSLETAESLGAELLERANETGEPDAALWYLNIVGFTYRQQGRCEEALAMFVPLTQTESAVTTICEAVVVDAALRGRASRRGQADRHAPLPVVSGPSARSVLASQHGPDRHRSCGARRPRGGQVAARSARTTHSVLVGVVGSGTCCAGDHLGRPAPRHPR